MSYLLHFHTAHGVLKARMLKWFAISFSSGPHSVRCITSWLLDVTISEWSTIWMFNHSQYSLGFFMIAQQLNINSSLQFFLPF